jgi:hypothetical protein
VRQMGRWMEAAAADGSLVEAVAEAARDGPRLLSLFSAAGYRRPRLWVGVWTPTPSSSGRPRLARGLCGVGTCVQRRAGQDEESSRRGGCVAGVGATARVCRMGRRRDGGDGGRRWNGVGRGRWGAGGRVHRRDCAGGRAEARIGRWGGEARAEVSARGFFAPASTDAVR